VFEGILEVDVVFVRPGAVTLRPCVGTEDGLVFVRPGAVVLRPCDAPEEGLVFVRPGAVVLRPCDAPAWPGADELRPRAPVADGGAC
jgi:hypothetical protein